MTAIAATAVGLPLAGGAAAAAPAPAASWPAALAHPAAASCPRGQTLIAPTGGWSDAMGVSHVTFRAAPGMTALVPPRGLTAARVTNAMATDIGLAPKAAARPSDHQQLVRRVLNLAQNRRAPEFCRAAPTAMTLPSGLPQAPSPAPKTAAGSPVKNTFFDSSNWGGTEVLESQFGSGINGAQGTWHVPDGTAAPKVADESTWVGIGASNGNNSTTKGLIQTGTSVVTDSGYESWYEAVGTSGCTPTTHFCGAFSSTNAVHNGDSVFGEVTWVTSKSACFYFEDNTRSTGSWDVCTPVNIPYDHTSAEWVNENHLPGTDYSNPHTVTFQNQYLSAGFNGAGPWKSSFAGAYASVVMGAGKHPTGSTNNCSNKTVLSYPVNMSNTATGGTSQILTCYISGIEGR